MKKIIDIFAITSIFFIIASVTCIYIMCWTQVADIRSNQTKPMLSGSPDVILAKAGIHH